jgi:hypothetical protein
MNGLPLESASIIKGFVPILQIISSRWKLSVLMSDLHLMAFQSMIDNGMKKATSK